MSIKNNIKRFLGRTKVLADVLFKGMTFEQFTSQFIAPRDGVVNNYSVRKQLDMIENWTFTCLSLLAESISAREMTLVNKDEEPVEKDKFESLFEKRDYFGTFSEKLEFAIMSYEATGIAAFWIPRTASALPLGIVPIPSNYIEFEDSSRLTMDELLRPRKVHLNINGHRQEMKDNELLLLMRPKLTGFTGISSPLNNFRYTLELNNEMDKYLNALFDNKAEAAVVLSSDQDITPEQADKMEARWKQKYQGKSKQGGVAVLGNGVKIDKFTITPKEMEYLESRNLTKKDIFTFWRVPPQIAGYLSNNAGMGRDEVSSSEYVYYKYRVMPLLNKIATAFTNFLYEGTGLHYKYLNVVPPDKDFELKRREMDLKSGVLVPNDLRKSDYDLDDVDWGNIPLPMALQRFQNEPESKKSVETNNGNIITNVNIKHKGIIFNRKIEADWEFIRRKKFERDKSQRDDFEKQYELKFINAYDDLLKMLLGSHKNYYKYISNGKPPESSVHYKEWHERLKINYEEVVMLSAQTFEEKLGPLIEDLHRKGIYLGVEDFTTDVAADASLQLSPDSEVTEFIHDYTNRRTKMISNNLYDRLSKILEQGLMSGTSERDLTKELQHQFDIEKHRASTIVRTDLGIAYAKAYHKGLAKNHMNSVWMTALDELVRLEHLRADGQEVAPGQKYLVWGEYLEHPLDTNASLKNYINCRCGEFGKLK